jgi:hypothetical protein
MKGDFRKKIGSWFPVTSVGTSIPFLQHIKEVHYTKEDID